VSRQSDAPGVSDALAGHLVAAVSGTLVGIAIGALLL